MHADSIVTHHQRLQNMAVLIDHRQIVTFRRQLPYQCLTYFSDTGNDYVLTEQDKADIADIVLDELQNADTMTFPIASEVNGS